MTDKSNSPHKRSWRGASKNMVFWMLIVLLSVTFYRMTVSRRDQHVEIDYTTFRLQLERDNIAAALERAQIG